MIKPLGLRSQVTVGTSSCSPGLRGWGWQRTCVYPGRAGARLYRRSRVLGRNGGRSCKFMNADF
jgi:hypothetical protein